MIDKLIRFYMSFVSFSIFLLVYLLVIDIPAIYLGFPVIIKFLLLILLLFFLNWFSLYLVKKLKADSIEIKDIAPIEQEKTPTYLGLFFTAMSLVGLDFSVAIILMFIIFVMWIFLEKNSYFNVFWLLFGYRFYRVGTKIGSSVILISRNKNIKKIKKIDKVYRLNDFTFIEIEENK